RAYYSVSKGTEMFSAPLVWAFGSGSVGQSYLFEHDSALYESRMSFLHDRGFDLTPGHPQNIPDALQFAIGRPIPADEQVKCFGCHTVASRSGNHFDPQQAILGISCEGCHGPGAAHVAIAKSGVGIPGMIFNPARLTPPQSLDFCGACHRAWWDVADVTDIHAVRFPALRLEQSRCWGNGDARLVCTSCHDPHQALVRETPAYDAKCLSCHQSSSSQKTTAERMGRACPVAAKDCVSCHMPKYEIPGMRLSFTDHKIRVIKAKDFQY
ncbi:MAG TPA: multiheme c-type cytochrome, partial [Terriglobales bacterium]|nr:multiheme c-type cytochrome [Terriglobales bacterium]